MDHALEIALEIRESSGGVRDPSSPSNPSPFPGTDTLSSLRASQKFSPSF
jgi:hypothetical protein